MTNQHAFTPTAPPSAYANCLVEFELRTHSLHNWSNSLLDQ
jgi:hypothetical protein